MEILKSSLVLQTSDLCIFPLPQLLVDHSPFLQNLQESREENIQEDTNFHADTNSSTDIKSKQLDSFVDVKYWNVNDKQNRLNSIAMKTFSDWNSFKQNLFSIPFSENAVELLFIILDCLEDPLRFYQVYQDMCEEVMSVMDRSNTYTCSSVDSLSTNHHNTNKITPSRAEENKSQTNKKPTTDLSMEFGNKILFENNPRSLTLEEFFRESFGLYYIWRTSPIVFEEMVSKKRNLKNNLLTPEPCNSSNQSTKSLNKKVDIDFQRRISHPNFETEFIPKFDTESQSLLQNISTELKLETLELAQYLLCPSLVYKFLGYLITQDSLAYSNAIRPSFTT